MNIKVKDLIEHLKTLDQDALVMTRGYEGGYDDVALPKEPKMVELNVHSEWYYGKHDQAA